MATDAFLKIAGPDVAGESSDHAHDSWIECLSYSWGMHQPVSTASGTGGRTADRVSIQDFSIMKVLDKASPDLFLHCAKGTHFKKATLQLHEATGDKHMFMEYVMEDVIISSVQPSGSGGGDKPMENLSLNFGKLQWTYTPIGHDGKPGSKVGPKGWNLETNKAL
jgi:type VI secretion system secreted protein Hcp